MKRALQLHLAVLAGLVLLLVGLSNAMAAPAPRVDICHIPPGNPAGFHTITVSENAVSAHEAHGDRVTGACGLFAEELCNDNDACTVDSFEPGTESCIPGAERAQTDCDDGDPSTIDSCDSVLGCINEQTCINPPSGLVSWWPGDGNAADIQGSNNGTLENGATFDAGKVDQAFSFDGVDDFVDIGTPPSLAFDNNDTFSIDAWININNTTTQNTIFTKSLTVPPNTGYVFKINNGVLNVLLQSNAINDIAFDGTTNLVPGIWYHAALTYDGSSTISGTKIYINGVEENKSIIANAPPLGSLLNSGNAVIGARVSGTNAIEHMNGLIDEVEIFNRALSAEEVVAIFNAGSSGKCK